MDDADLGRLVHDFEEASSFIHRTWKRVKYLRSGVHKGDGWGVQMVYSFLSWVTIGYYRLPWATMGYYELPKVTVGYLKVTRRRLKSNHSVTGGERHGARRTSDEKIRRRCKVWLGMDRGQLRITVESAVFWSTDRFGWSAAARGIITPYT